MVKKLIARAFWGYRAGPGSSCRHWWRLSHWASGSLFVQPVKHSYDRRQGPQGFKITLWKWGRHWAWGLQSLLPFPPLPPFLFSKHKTQRGCNLPSMGKGGTSCSSEWHCDGNGRDAWKGISRETQLRLPGRWQISYWHGTCCLCHCSWILADSHKKKKMFHKGKVNSRKDSCSRGPRENQQSCVERTNKAERVAPQACSPASRWRSLLLLLSFPI